MTTKTRDLPVFSIDDMASLPRICYSREQIAALFAVVGLERATALDILHHTYPAPDRLWGAMQVLSPEIDALVRTAFLAEIDDAESPFYATAFAVPLHEMAGSIWRHLHLKEYGTAENISSEWIDAKCTHLIEIAIDVIETGVSGA